MLYSLLLLLFAYSTDAGPAAHEFHVSKSRIVYDTETQAFQITLHVFIDDLELALAERGAEKLFVGTELEKPAADDHIEAYLRQHFQIHTPDHALAYQWLGKETADDLMGLFIYLEIPDQAIPKQLTVTNRLLTEVYDDQKNIVQVDIPNRPQGYVLCTRADETKVMAFE